MLKKVRIKSKDDKFFNECWNLYVSAFPVVERRAEEYQLETIAKEDCHFDAILDGETFVGFVGWWHFENLKYIEHFATLDCVRGKGYGAQILEMFKSDGNEPIILEVEHPEDELTTRRINFYKRNGFCLNPHYFAHPSYNISERKYYELLVMSCPSEISKEQLDQFCSKYFKIIHFKGQL